MKPKQHFLENALSILLNLAEDDETISNHERLWLFKVKSFICFHLVNRMNIKGTNSLQSKNYKVHQINSPPAYKLVRISGDLGEIEEGTFIAYGIILEKDLPPINIERSLFFSFS